MIPKQSLRSGSNSVLNFILKHFVIFKEEKLLPYQFLARLNWETYCCFHDNVSTAINRTKQNDERKKKAEPVFLFFCRQFYHLS